MPHIPDELIEIKKRVEAGEKPTTTVRLFLSWFWGSQRRGRWVTSVIRESLNALDLITVPDFNYTSLDGGIAFFKVGDPLAEALHKRLFPTVAFQNDAAQGGASTSQAAAAPDIPGTPELVSLDVLASLDPTYRIERLGLSAKSPVHISPDAKIVEAVTVMLRHDFSQLPVMTNDRDVKGIISWKTLGSRLSFASKCEFVREAAERHIEISHDDSLFHAISLLQQHDCVLVRGLDRKITGIITAYDVTTSFRQLAEPFLILGEIENHVRQLIDGKFTKQELASAKDPNDTARDVQSVANLTLGECVLFIANPKNWERLGLPVDRVIFIKDLEQVKAIRNEVMHFDPEGIGDDDLRTLREFVAFLERLRALKQQ